MTIARRIWRFLMAVKDALALLFLLLFFAILYMVMTSSPNPAAVKEGALVLALDGVVVEQPADVDPREALMGNVLPQGQIRLWDIVHGLDEAAKDKDVKALVLDMDGFGGAGQASLSRIAEALDGVRKSGKPVLAFASGYYDDSYFLAAHASEVWIDPMGHAVLQGPGGSQPYLKGLMDKLGVTARVYRVGTYKSAVEPFIRDSQSPEAKAAAQALYGALWSDWQDQVKRARPKAQIANAIADASAGVAGQGGDLAKASQALGMVDRIGDRIAFGKRVAEIAGRDDDERADSFKSTSFGDYLAARPEQTGSGRIGIVTVAGDIVDGSAPQGMAGGDTISDLILDAVADDDIKALVLRVNSGGGSAMASEKIRSALLAAKAKGLPVVVSMGDVAASGGYWVGMTGDRIFAEPSTITGSIGVFAVLPTFEKAAAKFGVAGDGVRTTPLSGQPDLLRGTNPETDKLLQLGVEDVYRRFTGLVSQSRKLTVARVDEIGQGRVWDGGTARQLGLIDAFGSLDDAIAEAARLAKVDAGDVERVWLEAPQGFLSGLLGNMVRADAGAAERDVFTRLVRKQQALVTTGLDDATKIVSGPALQVRCLECPPPVAQVTRSGLLDLVLEKLF